MADPEIERLWKMLDEFRKQIEQDQEQPTLFNLNGPSTNKRRKGESGFSIKPEARVEMQHKLGYEFKDETLLTRALDLESKDMENNHSVLKMLGRSIMQTCYFYHYIKKNPKISKGDLQTGLNDFFSKGECAKDGRNMGLDAYARRSSGQCPGCKRRSSEIECLYAALLGAIAVDSGFEKATSIFLAFRKWIN